MQGIIHSIILKSIRRKNSGKFHYAI